MIRKLCLLKMSFAVSMLVASQVFADAPKAKDLADKAQQKLQTGDIAKAEMLFARALQESPNDTAIQTAVARLYIQQHRYEEAETLLQSADQTDFRVWKTRSIALQSQKNEAESISALEKAFALGGKSDAYILSRLQMYYESVGNTAKQKQMENLQQTLSLQTK